MGCGKTSRESVSDTQKIQSNDTNQPKTENNYSTQKQNEQTQPKSQANYTSPKKNEQTSNKPSPPKKATNQKVQFDQSTNNNPRSEKQLQGKKTEAQMSDIFYKSFADTIIVNTFCYLNLEFLFQDTKDKQPKKQIQKETFLYKEKDNQFKDDFLKSEKKQELIIIQKKQEEIQDQGDQLLESQGIQLTAEILKQNQSADFLIFGRFKTKITYQKFSMTLPANSEQILIDAIRRILTQFSFLAYQDLIITQCGKEIPFVKCGGYLYNPKYPSFGIIINFAKAEASSCELKCLESQGFTPIELYETGKKPQELMFSQLFTAQQKYLKQFNAMKQKLKANSLKELLENEQFIQLLEVEKAYEKIQTEFETKCLKGIDQILNGELQIAIQLDQIYSNEFEQYIFDNDILIIMFKTFYDSDFKQLKKICSITKLISQLPGNDQIYPPQMAIFKKFNNCYFVCYTLLPITRRDYIYGSDEQSLLINSNLDESLSANQMKSLSEYWNSLGNLFNFQELILYEKCSDHKRHCKLPLGTCIYKNKFEEQGEQMPKYFILNFKNLIYPINNPKSMTEYSLLSETNFQLKDGIYYQNLKTLLPSNKNVQKKQINLIMDDYQKHKEEKQLLKEYFDNDLMSLSSSVMTENPAQSANSLQIEINEEGLKQLFNNKKFNLDHQSSLPIILHLYGIGIKNLGNIFKIAPNQLKAFILAEILARTFKNQILNYQILDEEEITNSTDCIETLRQSITKIVESFLNNQFNEDENTSFLSECQNQFSMKLSFEELSSYKLEVAAVTQRIMQLISKKLSYYSQKMILLRSSAMNQLTKVIISQYLGNQSKSLENEIEENKNELNSIIQNENFI